MEAKGHIGEHIVTLGTHLGDCKLNNQTGIHPVMKELLFLFSMIKGFIGHFLIRKAAIKLTEFND